MEDIDELLQILRLEIDRGASLYPQEMDIVRFIGVARLKLGSIEHRCYDHHTEMRRVDHFHARLAMVQLAAVAIRCIDQMDGITLSEYEHHVKTRKPYTFTE